MDCSIKIAVYMPSTQNWLYAWLENCDSWVCWFIQWEDRNKSKFCKRLQISKTHLEHF